MLRLGDLTQEHAAQCAFSTAVSDTDSIAVMNEQNLTRSSSAPGVASVPVTGIVLNGSSKN
ncbi:Cadherin-99C [Frankliniella fusca]|uniref:Cadherin-99C n=1 Tax=Frankliniella fusca TaxID=407009 RepID=A0AAE1LSZ3_9NEOP|nr:Cadherin-99C [Frankliniella fusca]